MIIRDTEGKTIISGNFGSMSKAVAAARNREISLCGADFSGVDLSGADFSGEDLSSKAVGIVGKHQFPTTFAGATLTKANFEGANLNHTIFSGANCSEASFTGANLGWSKFDKAKLANCKFDEVTRNPYEGQCFDPVFHDADLDGASFVGAKLHTPRFNGANLVEVDFSNSRLQWPTFAHANLHRANFFGCILDDPYFTLCTQDTVFNLLVIPLPYSYFSEADYDHTRYDGAFQVIATRLENRKVHITYQGGTWISKTNIGWSPKSQMRRRIISLVEEWGRSWSW